MKIRLTVSKCFPVLSILVLFLMTSSANATIKFGAADFDNRRILFKAAGYSQVEYRWPKSGIVCRHSPTTRYRSCDGLIPGERYKIVDFSNGRKATFTFPAQPAQVWVCNAGSNGNLKNVRYGYDRFYRHYITWDNERRPTFSQVQREEPSIQIVKQSMDEGEKNPYEIIQYVPSPYKLIDLTYGGKVTIDFRNDNGVVVGGPCNQ